jgi:hypothetical protein
MPFGGAWALKVGMLEVGRDRLSGEEAVQVTVA